MTIIILAVSNNFCCYIANTFPYSYGTYIFRLFVVYEIVKIIKNSFWINFYIFLKLQANKNIVTTAKTFLLVARKTVERMPTNKKVLI